MAQELLLIDFENVHQVDLSCLSDGTNVVIFIGASQKPIPIELVASAQTSGPRIEWKKIEGNGRNALDFHIACQLGRVLEKSSQVTCIVLSKDKGFDPLLRHLNNLGLKCKRVDSLLELDPKSAELDNPNYRRVFEVLRKSDKKSRPRNRKTQSQHISSMFQKKIAQKDIDRIINMLFAHKMISEIKNIISYGF